VHKENSLSSSKRRVSEKDTHRVVENSIGKCSVRSALRERFPGGHKNPLKGEEGSRPLGD
jgi:hypothetical protein